MVVLLCSVIGKSLELPQSGLVAVLLGELQCSLVLLPIGAVNTGAAFEQKSHLSIRPCSAAPSSAVLPSIFAAGTLTSAPFSTSNSAVPT